MPQLLALLISITAMLIIILLFSIDSGSDGQDKNSFSCWLEVYLNLDQHLLMLPCSFSESFLSWSCAATTSGMQGTCNKHFEYLLQTLGLTWVTSPLPSVYCSNQEEGGGKPTEPSCLWTMQGWAMITTTHKKIRLASCPLQPEPLRPTPDRLTELSCGPHHRDCWASGTIRKKILTALALQQWIRQTKTIKDCKKGKEKKDLSAHRLPLLTNLQRVY